MKDQDEPETPRLDVEGGGGSMGVPAMGAADTGANEPTERSGLHHWRESTITEPGLEARGNVFFAAIEMTRMPMILTDPNIPDNPIVFANKAFLDLTGYEEREVVGRNCRFLQGAQTDRNAVADLRDAVAAKGSIALEMLNYRRDGSPFWNAVFIGPVHDTCGKLLYFFASQLDVTRRRNIEQSFRQAQKMEAIGQLTAGLAHDFNNLLQVVNGNLELLGMRTDDPRSQRYVQNARAAAERGAKLTRQLLAFARKTRLEPRLTDMAALLDDFGEVMESSVGNDVRLSVEVEPELPTAVIDPDQLEMVLLNIVMNARDASPGGSPVAVRARRTRLADGSAGDLQPGDYLALEVADEGSGMPPEVIERATEPFFTTKGVGKGTGLGLAMASGFMRQSRGRLEIDSAVGRGTTVRMLFPVAREAPAARTAEEPTGLEYHPAIAQLDEAPAEHILVVEDSAEVLELACEILRGAGYRVTCAEDGERGLAAFEEAHDAGKRFDLLFTDLIMPGGINGLRLADRVTERDPKMPVLLTTGYNEELVVNDARRRSSDVLSKPYRRSELLDRVRQSLNRTRDGPRRRTSDFGAVEA
ncbi:MAG: Signal transduction histidine kinase [uncultured Sphingomonadaceae bacterium]|uniref:histidine kinase n=1 Tax=uncultured Sphingomonadaceae bacterium TaxID=169976 RepID=A0A6J4S9Y6_9SPHN|nr:MAG: Signal transduction histidine kinase [uncultured Sphingomonadaceae bacterium]